MRTTHDLDVVQLPLTDAVRHPDNYRRGDVALIAESLDAHGQYAPIVVQKSTGHIVKGNHTADAARQLEWDTIGAVVLDIDDDQAKRILVMDNRATDAATNDNEMLLAVLQSIEDDLTGSGYDDVSLAMLLDGLNDDVDVGGDGLPGLGDVAYSLMVECDDEAQQTELLGELLERGLEVRPVMI